MSVENGTEMDRIERRSEMVEPRSVIDVNGEGHEIQLSEITSMPPEKTPQDEIANADASKLNGGNAGPKGLQKESEKMVKIKKKIGIMIIVAFFAIVLGLTAGILWPSMFDGILRKELTLSNVSTSYKMWKETPVPMYLKIYLFNWTNHDQIKENFKVKPHFNQMGPYVFREIDTKVNQQWNDNGTITFQQKRVWHFQPDMSNGTLSDKVTNLNPIAATIAYTVRHRGTGVKFFVNAALKKLETIAITKTVNELLFEGYDDVLLKTVVDLNLTTIPFEKFAWFYARNESESYDGTFTLMTGANNFYDTGMITEWKFNNVSQQYSETCGKINGTLGDLWPPLPNNKTVSVFSPDVCTSLSLTEAGPAEWLGLTGTKYVSDENMLDNGTKVESRKCYCRDIECQPSGTLNVSSCKFGAPAFVSLPHFYLADKSYRERISGMHPKKEDHEFSLIVQPLTGTPMKVRAALQISFLVRPDKDLTYFKDLPEMYAPMLWFTQEVELTSDYASQVKLLVILPVLGCGLMYGVAAIGILLVIISIILYVRQRLEDDQNENLIPKENRDRSKDADVINNEE